RRFRAPKADKFARSIGRMAVAILHPKIDRGSSPASTANNTACRYIQIGFPGFKELSTGDWVFAAAFIRLPLIGHEFPRRTHHVVEPPAIGGLLPDTDCRLDAACRIVSVGNVCPFIHPRKKMPL